MHEIENYTNPFEDLTPEEIDAELDFIENGDQPSPPAGWSNLESAE